MTPPLPVGEEVTSDGFVAVTSGTRSACEEAGLVLAARGIPYVLDPGGTGEQRPPTCVLFVAQTVAAAAREELARYAAERPAPVARAAVPSLRLFPRRAAVLGAVVYALILFGVALLEGQRAFGIDWVRAGALDTRVRGEWWRAVTALTLHAGPEHLFGNSLFGAAIGVLAARLFGVGMAWAGILAAGVLGNGLDALFAPPAYGALGASTAVFGGLGLLSGFTWRTGAVPVEERWLRRGAPLVAGIGLLAMFGAGAPQVDVFGHLFGFASGVAVGRAYAPLAQRPLRDVRLQMTAAGVCLAAVACAWVIAINSSA